MPLAACSSRRAQATATPSPPLGDGLPKGDGPEGAPPADGGPSAGALGAGRQARAGDGNGPG